MTKAQKLLLLPEEVENTLNTCALRFDGYRWRENQRHQDPSFSPWINPILDSMTLHTDEATNFAVFFALQRFLGKWGGEQLSEDHRCHTAFRFLFLHLYAKPTPREYVFEQYEAEWRSIPGQVRESHAGIIREALLNSLLGKRPRA